MALSSDHGIIPHPSYHAKAFEQLLRKKACSCGRSECRDLLRDYYLDPASPYPDPKSPQLIFDINNVQMQPESRQKRQGIRKQQLYDRISKLLGSNCDDRKYASIAIHHFSPDVIRAFAADPKSCHRFLDYLLPSSLVSSSRLGVPFTAVDRFICIGTDVEDKTCQIAEKQRKLAVGGDGLSTSKSYLRMSCSCNRYLNVPFLTIDAAKANISTGNSRRSALVESYSATRRDSMVLQEIAVQSQSNSRLRDKTDLVTKKIKFVRSQAEDEMNVVAGRMHTEYAKLQREYCNLQDDCDRHKKDSTKLRGRLDTVEGKFQ
jgi:hypothetical protein